ncbi:splicing factor 3B subunit 5 [Salpingoeca rosetta]|uniref:Splicing factor subunit n=1 Tax=Salpingoeca rosetta (strain ATCC 50818 / BSB-021) TaxID=946362 RepID=F2UED0_SALR5|nr:splicing factor 3B subunit 5 [Salpingoeca rosetta]EGD74980.1 splicing factor 3B subunit 5 [Salpingoeca rosetta]|eukprot:XP_004992625.1 splicing factor 3B subunit 5 [Salpingoeca rosetta]
MAESRYNIHSQQEHLQSKYMGTGHADTTKHEWVTNQHRDTYTSMIGHEGLMDYVSIAENESRERTRFNLLQRMISPCGPPVKKADAE